MKHGMFVYSRTNAVWIQIAVSTNRMGGVLVVGVLIIIIRAPLFGVYIKAPDFGKFLNARSG